jgi:hypothetical protein
VVWINGRSAAKLERAAASLREATGATVHAVVADLNTDAGRSALVAACPEPDILVNNNAGPPPGQLADWDHVAWLGALEANLIAGVLLIRAVLPGMRARRFGRIVNITSAMVKTPHAAMGLSTAARAGLTAVEQGARARGRRRQRDDQQPAARAHRHAAPGLHGATHGGCGRHHPARRPASASPTPCLRAGSASPMNWPPRAPSSAARGPGSSPARTCRSTEARTPVWCTVAANTGGLRSARSCRLEPLEDAGPAGLLRSAGHRDGFATPRARSGSGLFENLHFDAQSRGSGHVHQRIEPRRG